MKPTSKEMARVLRMSETILDHYSACQGPRVLKLMKSAPEELLREMYEAALQLNRTKLHLARLRGVAEPMPKSPGYWSIKPEAAPEIEEEAYQSLYPASEEEESEELTRDERLKLEDWLYELATS